MLKIAPPNDRVFAQLGVAIAHILTEEHVDDVTTALNLIDAVDGDILSALKAIANKLDARYQSFLKVFGTERVSAESRLVTI